MARCICVESYLMACIIRITKNLRCVLHGGGFCYVEKYYSILERNAFSLGCFGLVNSSCGGSSS